MNDEEIRKSYDIAARSTGRIPESGLSNMNINDYIASTEDMSRLPNPPEGESEGLKRTAGMYAYLRDNFHPKTLGEANQVMASGKVDPKVVKLWVEEGMAVNPGPFDSIAAGYPQFKPDLERVRTERINKILHQP